MRSRLARQTTKRLDYARKPAGWGKNTRLSARDKPNYRSRPLAILLRDAQEGQTAGNPISIGNHEEEGLVRPGVQRHGATKPRLLQQVGLEVRHCTHL